MKIASLLPPLLAGFVAASCNQEVKEKLQVRTVELPAESRNKDSFEVTKKFGVLKVREGEFAAESKNIPWTSWWYPLNERTLFYNSNGGASTLEKYDFYAGKVFGEQTEATLVEEREIYKPNEVAWAGLCHAWAIASVLHPEPKKEKVVGNVKWTVADQKALLIKTYEKATGINDIIFGGRFDGNRGDDFNDIYPDQFHKLAQKHLIENNLPFLMDYDPRYPVWTVPVYRIKFQIEKRDEESALVTAWTTMATPRVQDLNYVGTKRVVKGYKYILYGKWNGNVLIVSKGEWVEESKNDHPDYLISYPDAIKRGSLNQEIKINIVDSILN